jgi:hypothetical protein
MHTRSDSIDCYRRLADIRRLQAAEKRRGPYERRVYAAMRVFERYQTAAEAEALCQGMFAEQQLRQRIEDLKQLRRLGARTFVQGEMLQVRCLDSAIWQWSSSSCTVSRSCAPQM